MKKNYRITPEGAPERLTDAEIAQHRDPQKLLYNYQRARMLLHRRPLYKDPKAFLALLLIVLITILVVEARERKRNEARQAPSRIEQPAP
jgi:hypothetical protein